MLEIIERINSAVNGFIWGVPAMICIIGVGLVLSFRTGFIQIRKFGHALKNTIGRIFEKQEASAGAMTPFQAVCTALTATVGTGNIAGVAGAIAIGGPGAVFWMWISALLGMCTKFSEVVLAVHFREKNKHGDYVGGPMYYIKNGLGKKWIWLAYLFAGFGAIAVLGTGNATQVNTITTAINSALTNYNLLGQDSLKLSNLVIGIVIAFIAAIVLVITLIGNSKNNQIYQYIESAAYGTAMSEMEELYEEGQNIDEVAAAFIEACMRDREYKRIPAAIGWLSEEYCEQNEELFTGMIQQMLSSGKEARAEDVLNTMEGIGGVRAQYAAAIRQE